MPPAGQVDIVFRVNKGSYTADVLDMKKQMDGLANAATGAGKKTVGANQAAAASFRAMNNPLNMNIRTLAVFAAQSEIAGKVFQAAFPVIGAIAAVAMIAKLSTEIAAFIKKVDEMPKTIERGFASLHLATTSATDSLRLTNDELRNSIAKFEGKPQNNLAIVLDETRVKADELAKSLEQDTNKVKEFLAANKSSGFSVLLGKAGTASVTGSVNSFNNDLSDLGGKYADAVRGGNTGAASDLKRQIDEKQKAALEWSRQQQFFRAHPDLVTNDMGMQDMAGDQSSNQAILRGFSGTINDSRDLQAQKDDNGDLVAKDKGAKDAHDAALKAAEARKKEAEEMAKGWQTSLELAKQADELARDMAKFAAESNNDLFKSQGLSTDDIAKLDRAGKSVSAWSQAVAKGAEDSKRNADAIAESSIQMALATGQMTKLDAAQAVAALHTQQYTDALKQLQSQRDTITTDHRYDQDPFGRRAALTANQTDINNLGANRQMQVASDNQTYNPASSSGSVGFVDALNEFVNASKDAAGQMRELTDGTLKTLNQQFVMAMSGQRTDFSNMGAGIFRNVAGMGLQKAEGSILGGLGFGGKADGSSEKPFYVKMADKTQNAVSGIGGLFSKMFGGGSKGSGASGLASLMNNVGESQSDDAAGGGIGTIASVLTNVIPFLASGGPIDGPAIVGENGPELYVPNSSGSIVPNHKLSSMGANSTTIAIDARGAGDPAQVQVAINKAIMAAAPHIMQGAVHLGRNMSQRKPTSSPR